MFANASVPPTQARDLRGMSASAITAIFAIGTARTLLTRRGTILAHTAWTTIFTGPAGGPTAGTGTSNKLDSFR